MNVWDTFCIEILNVNAKCLKCEGGLPRSTMYKDSRSVFEFNFSLSLSARVVLVDMESNANLKKMHVRSDVTTWRRAFLLWK